jgi:hypothetical protein
LDGATPIAAIVVVAVVAVAAKRQGLLQVLD